jgi:hypothetical protein
MFPPRTRMIAASSLSGNVRSPISNTETYLSAPPMPAILMLNPLMRVVVRLSYSLTRRQDAHVECVR